jgi:hypothetical protein
LNDSEVDAYISNCLKEKDICLQDMIGPKYIDPEPENKRQHWKERARWNRFKSTTGEMRLCELLTEGEFDPERPYENLGIAPRDIIRYWWNSIADQEYVLGMVFEEVFTEYKDRMLPEEPEQPLPDYVDSLDGLLEAV